MNKPSWINEVKEVTVEEADLLFDLGVDVHWDGCGGKHGWRWGIGPFIYPGGDRPSDVVQVDPNLNHLFYIRKEED